MTLLSESAEQLYGLFGGIEVAAKAKAGYDLAVWVIASTLLSVGTIIIHMVKNRRSTGSKLGGTGLSRNLARLGVYVPETDQDTDPGPEDTLSSEKIEIQGLSYGNLVGWTLGSSSRGGSRSKKKKGGGNKRLSKKKKSTRNKRLSKKKKGGGKKRSLRKKK